MLLRKTLLLTIILLINKNKKFRFYDIKASILITKVFERVKVYYE
jgi:hypothetical protein